jgi:LCP family protein required for cell wall assembly
VLVLVAVVGGVAYFDSKLHRSNALADYPGRPADTPGTTWLLVGSDSRQGMTAAQQKQLDTGGDLGNGRTDTMMLAHIPTSGRPMLISVPRDLFVTVPGQGKYKLNAAYYLGGPQLLQRTVETATKIRIDHYAEIGFEGFAGMVDSLGGINICVDAPMNDPKAGAYLKAGCQTLTGTQALAYVRSRATPSADLDRVVHQRKFMAALLSEVTAPSTLVNPFKVWGVASGAVDALTVDEGTHLWDLGRLGWALRSNPVTTTVPTGGDTWTSDGDALAWGADTTEFFSLLASGQPIPDRLLSGPTP